MLNPICEVRIDTVIDKRRTHRGIAIAVSFTETVMHAMFMSKNLRGFLPNLLMNEEISAIKITGAINEETCQVQGNCLDLPKG